MKAKTVAIMAALVVATAIALTYSTLAVDIHDETNGVEPSYSVATNEPIAPIEEPEDAVAPETTAPETTEPETVVEYDPWDHIPLEADVRAHVVSLCEEKGIAPEIVFAMIWRESRYDADAIGDNGRAFGLLQVHPRWHQDRMDRLGVTDLLDPIQNVTVAVDLLDELHRKYNNLTKAIVAYNRGHYDGAITEYAMDVLEEAARISPQMLTE